jgi:hypothetical protein
MTMARDGLHFWIALPIAIFGGCAQGAPLGGLGGSAGAAGVAVSDGSAGATRDVSAPSDVAEAGAAGAGGAPGVGGSSGSSGSSGSGGSPGIGGSVDAEASVAPTDASLGSAEAGDGSPNRNDTGAADAGADASIVRNDASDSGNTDVSRDAAEDSAVIEAGPPAPCTGLCDNPIVFTTNPYGSGALGLGATCHQTTLPVFGVVCGNLPAPRTFAVNGVVVACDGMGRAPGIARNGGYCFQVIAGSDGSSAYFNTY